MPKPPMSDLLRAEVQGAVAAAGAVDAAAVADSFYAWAKGKVAEDPVTHRASGLDLLPAFQEDFPGSFRATPAPAPAKRAKRIVVDLDREQSVPIGAMLYTFRPGAIVTDPYIIAEADRFGIPLVEK